MVCGLKGPCGDPPSVYMADLLVTVKGKADEVTARGRTPLVVHIGADGLRNGAMWTDVHLYKEVISDLQNATRHTKLQRKLNLYQQVASQLANVKMIFVEPVASKSGDFWRNVGRLPIDRDRVELVTAFADGDCEEPFGTLYKLNHDLISRDFHPWDFRITDGWTSMSKGWIWNPMRTWLNEGRSQPCGGSYSGQQCREDFRKLLELPNRTSYIQELKVPCVTVQSLLESIGGSPSDVVMLNVDTEGHDCDILKPAASNDAFRPAFVMWEGGWQSEVNTGVVQTLRGRGYLVGSKPGPEVQNANQHAHFVDSANIVAVLRPPAQAR
mmetsp:Transcript_41396/g.95952  ORF Transcript_41396/g.95952 Transcript_41396/m.95952 type:complete len:326 (+) Transcript_41396:2-979(+)